MGCSDLKLPGIVSGKLPLSTSLVALAVDLADRYNMELNPLVSWINHVSTSIHLTRHHRRRLFCMFLQHASTRGRPVDVDSDLLVRLSRAKCRFWDVDAFVAVRLRTSIKVWRLDCGPSNQSAYQQPPKRSWRYSRCTSWFDINRENCVREGRLNSRL
jgi:hypothetical protein